MNVKITIDLNTETGEYEMHFFSNEGKTMDQQELVKLLRKVFEQWNLKFVD